MSCAAAGCWAVRSEQCEELQTQGRAAYAICANMPGVLDEQETGQKKGRSPQEPPINVQTPVTALRFTGDAFSCGLLGATHLPSIGVDFGILGHHP